VAYQLARERKSVVVLDDGPIAGGETERTTAHLSYTLDDRFFNLEKIHGLEKTRLAVQSHQAAIEEIEATVERENIPCDFTRLDGYLFVPRGASFDILEAEYECSVRLGLKGIEFVPRAPLPDFDTGRCLKFPAQGQFHPLKYLSGLLRAIQEIGGRVYANTRALEFKGGMPAKVTTTEGFEIRCRSIIVATNSPVNDRVKTHSKQAAYRTYAVAGEIPKGSVPQGLYWDTAQDAESQESEPMSAPYHYVRLQDNGATSDLLIIGGEDHKTGQANDASARWANLEQWARERFPGMSAPIYRWSGQVLEPADGLAYIGRNPGDEHNVYIVTGDSGHGMTHGTIAGMLLRDLILERPNAWEQPYDPSRKATGASATIYARENLNVARKYGEVVTGGDVKSVDEIPPDSGAVLRRGLRKLAVYRAEDGTLHEFYAVCPHLKCIVHWNSAERSWDCPCHGSRFSRFGDVLNGPALTGLSREEDEQQQSKAA
jgi:glycine/D-amino acid oxidase-like deaminating enzyme/nitrite reductase/ring-hydroxylating ferredoxin subunit